MIPPGQVGKIHTSLDTANQAGLIGKGVSITTNDPVISIAQVVIRARVVGSVLMLPGYKAMVSNRNPEMHSTHFLIRKEPGETGDASISEPRASVDWIDVEVEELTEKFPSEKGIPAGWPGDWRLVATLKKGAPSGRFNETIRFKTGLPREPEVTLQLAVVVQPPINLNTEEIRLVPGQPQVVLASVRQDLRQLPVELNAPEGLSARVESGGRRFLKLHLQWNGPAPEAPVELQLEVGGEKQIAQIHVGAAD